MKYEKISIKAITIFISILIVSGLFVACPPPQNEDRPNPPHNVRAKFVCDIPVVSWDGSDAATEYLVYRKAGDGPFALIDSGTTGSTSFTDSNFPADKKLQYAVQSKSNSLYSTRSEPSNIISLYVQNVRATQLVYTNKIRVSWDIHPDEVTGFKVYRYLNKVDQNPTVFEDITTNYYEDTAVTAGTPCFYRVSWVDIDGEHGENGFFAMGLINGSTDIYEPNNDFGEARKLTFVSEAGAWIFSFNDGAGSAMCDTDWYSFTKTSGLARTLFVTVKLPAKSQFDRNLKLRFFHSGQFVGTEAQVLIAGVENIAAFDLASGEDTDYFEIFSVLPSSYNIIDSYTVTTSYEM